MMGNMGNKTSKSNSLLTSVLKFLINFIVKEDYDYLITMS